MRDTFALSSREKLTRGELASRCQIGVSQHSGSIFGGLFLGGGGGDFQYVSLMQDRTTRQDPNNRFDVSTLNVQSVSVFNIHATK